MKFLLDADLPNSTVEPFREAGQEAAHVREMGLGEADDEEIVSYAAQHGYIIVSRDQDFGNPLLHDPADHNGVVILRLPSTYKTEKIKERMKRFLRNVDPEEIGDAIVIVETGRYRVRKSS